MHVCGCMQVIFRHYYVSQKFLYWHRYSQRYFVKHSYNEIRTQSVVTHHKLWTYKLYRYEISYASLRSKKPQPRNQGLVIYIGAILEPKTPECPTIIRPLARIFGRGVTSMSNVYVCVINKQAVKTRGVWGDAPPGNF